MDDVSEKLIEWTRENVPLLTAYGEDAVRGVVRRAINETVWARISVTALAIVVCIAISQLIDDYLNASDADNAAKLIVVGVAGALGAYLGNAFGTAIIRNRIRRLASNL